MQVVTVRTRPRSRTSGVLPRAQAGCYPRLPLAQARERGNSKRNISSLCSTCIIYNKLTLLAQRTDYTLCGSGDGGGWDKATDVSGRKRVFGAWGINQGAETALVRSSHVTIVST